MKLLSNNGFTLIELMVAIFVLSLVLTLGVPAFSGFAASNRMATGVNDLVSTLHGARMEAVKRRGSVAVCASTDWNTATPSCTLGSNFRDGWIAFLDVDGDITVDAGELVLATHGEMANTIVLSAVDINGNPVGQQFFSFAGSGFLQAGPGGPSMGSVELCDHRGDFDVGGGLAAGRFVSISATGRPQIFRQQADVQNVVLNPLGGC